MIYGDFGQIVWIILYIDFAARLKFRNRLLLTTPFTVLSNAGALSGNTSIFNSAYGFFPFTFTPSQLYVFTMALAERPVCRIASEDCCKLSNSALIESIRGWLVKVESAFLLKSMITLFSLFQIDQYGNCHTLLIKARLNTRNKCSRCRGYKFRRDCFSFQEQFTCGLLLIVTPVSCTSFITALPGSACFFC